MDKCNESDGKFMDEYNDMTNFTLQKSKVRIIENLDDKNLWASFGITHLDFAMRDMEKLIFSSLDLCSQFYIMYTKSKGFRIQ